jgi:hypothetical protein
MTPTQPPIEDLIYTRLDLPQPPEVDTDALMAWALEASGQPTDERQIHDNSPGTGTYPWVGAYVANHGEFNAEFARQFPELVEYFKNFPTKRWRNISLVCQRADMEVFLHTDPGRKIGWRVYLNHSGARFYVQKFLKRHDERPQTWVNGLDGIKALCHPERIYVEDQGRFAWAISGIRAAHAVERNGPKLGSRMTLVLTPYEQETDSAEVEAMLRRGAEKYADSAIWY